jgi:tetratricopeptide (TPR) repeat protein
MKHFFIFLISVFFINLLQGQDVGYLIKEGEQLEKEKKDADALKKYQEALQLAPNDIKALYKCSELSGTIGNRQPDKNSKLEYYNAAKLYAETALKLNADDPDANFAMAMALSRISQVTSGKEKIQDVKDIKTYAEHALEQDSGHYKSLYLMGKWNMEVSSLNIAEKAALKVVYGGLPSASVGAAIAYYERCRKSNPNFILNYLDLAKAYKADGHSDKAIDILNRMLKLPPKTADDNDYKAEGKKLLESLL